MKSTYVIILGAGPLQVPIIEEINKRGWRSVVIDQDPLSTGAKFAHKFLAISTRDIPEILSTIQSCSWKKQLAYCVTVGTDMTPSVAAINEHFDLPGLRPKQSEVTTHKGKMRRFLEKAGLPQPKWFSCSEKEKIYQWAQKYKEQKEKESCLGFVMKPVDNMGARGVIYLKSVLDISFAFELAYRESYVQEVIMEEYIEGNEISVDALIYDGECFLTGVADRIIEKHDDMYFTELGHNMPTSHSSDVIDKIQGTMQKISDALGSLQGVPYHGALKGDLKLTKKNEIIVNEVASRLSGGFMSTHTFPTSTNVNLMELYIDLITQNKQDFIRKAKNIQYKNVCIERSILPKVGLIQETYTPVLSKEKTAAAELAGFFSFHKKGDIIYPLKNNLGKFAHTIIQAKDLKSAESLWKQINKKFYPKVEMPVVEKNFFRKRAKKNFNDKFCWVCRICDGKNCASSVPGMGGVGDMHTFQENIQALQAIKIIPRYLEGAEKEPPKEKNVKISDNPSKIKIKEPKASEQEISLKTSILGIPMNAPLLTAPITGGITNMGGSISEWDYAFETGWAAKSLGLIPTFGDGASPDKYWTGLRVIEKLQNRLSGF